MDIHKQCLDQLCRLCGGTLEDRHSVAEVSDIIHVALAINIDLDQEGVHPKSLCSRCFLKLKHWKAESGKKHKNFELNIVICEFTHHDKECVVCKDKEPAIVNIVANSAKQFDDVLIYWNNDTTYLVVLDTEGNTSKCMTFKEDGSWSVRVYGRLVRTDHPQLGDVPHQIIAEAQVKSIISITTSLNICPGNPEYAKLTEEQLDRNPVYYHMYPNALTVRHASCPLLTPETRCGPCKIYRSTLATMSKRKGNSESIHTAYRNLTRSSLEQKLRDSQSTTKSMKRRIAKLETIISDIVSEDEDLPAEQPCDFEKMQKTIPLKRLKQEYSEEYLVETP